jgi:hypothetical protein
MRVIQGRVTIDEEELQDFLQHPGWSYLNDILSELERKALHAAAFADGDHPKRRGYLEGVMAARREIAAARKKKE